MLGSGPFGNLPFGSQQTQPSNQGIGSSLGVSAAQGVGKSIAVVTGAITGHATVSGVGAAAVRAVGATAGQATVTGISAEIFAGVGDAEGDSEVQGWKKVNLLRPNTRLFSWEQMCVEADPDFLIERRQPLQYEFSNGREFYHPL